MSSSTDRMPVLFVGHGSPMNAIEANRWSRGFRALGASLPEPRAILAISAHWYVPGTLVTAQAEPKTIHDFAGFPQDLYQVRYPAPGSPDLAERVMGLLGTVATATEEWGLDHGSWTVLHHLRPQADCPVVQLSLNWDLDAASHLALAWELQPLRAEGVLIMGSGNIVHNLAHAMRHHASPETPDWARRFDADVARAVEGRDSVFLCEALATSDGQMSHPSPDHYLPLLYAYGAAGDDDAVAFPVTGFDMSSLSMRAVLFR